MPIAIDDALPCVDFDLGDIASFTYLMRMFTDIYTAINIGKQL